MAKSSDKSDPKADVKKSKAKEKAQAKAKEKAKAQEKRDRERLELFLVPPRTRVRLKDYDPSWDGGSEAKDLAGDTIKDKAKKILDATIEDLAAAQDLLYADDRHALLIVLQAMDAAGKDGMIKHVMSGINPQGCQVHSFKKPSDEEIDHDFLWRCACRLPERGRIGIFNRSYYEEVLVAKVHPQIIAHQRLPRAKVGKRFWRQRYESINEFERHLARNGTVILKFFLNVSKKEQKKRFVARLDDPNKNWKFSVSDLEERNFWDDYQKAYEQALSATSTKWGPWHVIPADNKWVARAVVARIIAAKIRSLDLRYPEVDDKKRALLDDARKQLEGG
jgi:PPK2 family polyphosphate:nucleotide phosphotransferase